MGFVELIICCGYQLCYYQALAVKSFYTIGLHSIIAHEWMIQKNVTKSIFACIYQGYFFNWLGSEGIASYLNTKSNFISFIKKKQCLECIVIILKSEYDWYIYGFVAVKHKSMNGGICWSVTTCLYTVQTMYMCAQ